MRKLVIFGAVVCLAAFLGSGVWPENTISQDARPTAAGDSILTIPACAFTDWVDGYNFERGHALHVLAGSGNFLAPVNIPTGSVIKKIILICLDNGGLNISLTLYRASQSGSVEAITSVSSSGSLASYRIFSQTLTSKKYVNTWKFSHYLYIWLPGTGGAGYVFSQAKIVYTPPSP